MLPAWLDQMFLLGGAGCVGVASVAAWGLLCSMVDSHGCVGVSVLMVPRWWLVCDCACRSVFARLARLMTVGTAYAGCFTRLALGCVAWGGGCGLCSCRIWTPPP